MKHFKIASLTLCFCFFVSCGNQVNYQFACLSKKVDIFQSNMNKLEESIWVINEEIWTNEPTFYWKNRNLGKIEYRNLQIAKEIAFVNPKKQSVEMIVTNSAKYTKEGKYRVQIHLLKGEVLTSVISVYYLDDWKKFIVEVSCDNIIINPNPTVHDINDNNIEEIAYRIQEPVTGEFFTVFVELSNPPRQMIFKADHVDSYMLDGKTKKVILCIETGYCLPIKGINDLIERPHFVAIDNGRIIDVSYRYPKDCYNVWNSITLGITKKLGVDVFNILTFNEQVGVKKNLIGENYQLKYEEHIRRFFEDHLKKGFLLQAESKDYFNKIHLDLSYDYENYSRFEDIEKSYKVFRELTNKKDFTGNVDFYFSLIKDYTESYPHFNIPTDEEKKEFAEAKKNKIHYKSDWEIESNSYWPERRICRHYLKPTSPTNIKIFNSDKKTPLVTKIKNVIFQESYKKDYEKIALDNNQSIKFYTIPIDSDKFFIIDRNIGFMIALRENTDGSLTQLSNSYNAHEHIYFSGFGDINNDGFKDYIFEADNWGATHNGNTHYYLSYINGILYEIYLDSFFQIEHFFGINNGIGLFGSEDIGCAPIYPGYYDCEASVKFAPLHYLEFRKDGYVYDVTYKHIDSEMYELANKLLKGEPIEYSFFNLPLFDLMGLTRNAQKNLLDTIKPKDEFENNLKKIITDLQKEDKPFLLQDCKEVPKNWQALTPYS